MYPRFDKEETQELLNGLYCLTDEFKKILWSKEYNRGKGLYKYLNALKSGNMKKICRLMFKSNHSVDAIINASAYTKPQIDDYMTTNRIAVYTSIFGSYDNLKNPVLRPENIDYFIVTDQEIPENSVWNVIDYKTVIPDDIVSPIERNRYVKIMPHKVFEKYDYSIYVDGNVFITSDLSILIKTLDDFPIAMHRHKNRDCVYQEIEACILKGKDSEKRLRKHEKLLREHGIPEHAGLLEATVIARKHSDCRCISVMEKWWDEFQQYSKRDQISLVDSLWTLGVSIDSVARLGDNIMDNHHFVIIPHI